MKALSIALAGLAGISGLIAAWRWYRSSQIPIDPGWQLPGTGGLIEPTDEASQAIGWAMATINAFNEASGLNRKAALWTAASVLLSAASAIAGAIST